MFAEKCKSLRREKNLSQEQLAEICEVSRQTVSKWESGIMMPEMDKLVLLSDFFDVSLDYLVKDNANEQPKASSMVNPVFFFEKICELILPRRNKMEVLYEDAELYDIIYDDQRNNAIKYFWEQLDLSKYGIKTIHDCSIGTGQLTIPLSMLGFEVSGSDISCDMLERCKKNTEKYGVNIALTQCDFRELTNHVSGKYDCVMSTGNSLAHVENKDVLHTLHEMDKLVNPNGYIYFDLRNWDLILQNHQRFYFYHPFYVDNQRINLIQVWDYNLDGTITFNLVYSFEKDNRIIDKKISSVYYYPISREIIIDELKEMGYTIIFEKPYPDRDEKIEHCDWYQVLAQKNRSC